MFTMKQPYSFLNYHIYYKATIFRVKLYYTQCETTMIFKIQQITRKRIKRIIK